MAMQEKLTKRHPQRDEEDAADVSSPEPQHPALSDAETEQVLAGIDKALEGEELAEALRFAQAKADWARAYSDEAQQAWVQKYGAAYKIKPTGVCTRTEVVRG